LTTDTVMKKKFCHFCGSRLSEKYFEGRIRLFCEGCLNPIYENPVPASCVIAYDELNRLLLVKRNEEPQKGYWCLPGGFMEIGETPEEAALREFHEETGLGGRIERLVGILTHNSPRYGSILVACFIVGDLKGKINPGDDASEARFFEMDELPEVAFDSHLSFIRAFYSGYISTPLA